MLLQEEKITALQQMISNLDHVTALQFLTTEEVDMFCVISFVSMNSNPTITNARYKAFCV